MTTARSSWAAFWKTEPAADSGATLASLPVALRGLLDTPWVEFAAGLPRKSSVLDLATGGGIVLQLLRHRRSDLKLTGVDQVSCLPELKGMALRGGVRTESLPFADGTFDAVTSRFGIEYGDHTAGAREAARVLRRTGSLAFLVHHSYSNVLRHNRMRRDALRWAAQESGWVGKALSLARARGLASLPTPPAFRSAPGEAVARFPDQPAAWEFLTGLVQVLELAPAIHGEASVLDLVRRADAEMMRLNELLGAACDESRLPALTDALTVAGVKLAPIRTVDEPDGTPIAWWIEGRKVS